MGFRSGFNVTWLLISLVIIGNMILFQMLFSNVQKYVEKIVSTKSSKYELLDI